MGNLLHPAGIIALLEKKVILVTFLLSGIVIIPVCFFLLFFAFKYRAKDQTTHVRHAPTWDHDNWRAEVLWWLIPTIIVLILSIIAWQSSHALDPYRPLVSDVPSLTVQVVALDWKWLFIYPDQGIASVNELRIPTGTPVHFLLTADAPMNSFWIPRLSGQIMVMPGMQTQLYIQTDTSGSFYGSSANISGEGFAGMGFTVTAMPPEEFQDYVASVKVRDLPLTPQTYAELAAPSQYIPPRIYSSVTPNLFTSVIMKFMMPMQGMSQGVHVLKENRMTAMPGMPGMAVPEATSSPSL